MSRPWIPSRLNADVLALELNAERAGCALACAFSSSEEFEAAVVRARRAAGNYGLARHRRYAIVCAVATGLAAILLCIS